MTGKLTPLGHQEATFQKNELMVSQSNLTGSLSYCNDVYCRVMEVSTAEALGQAITFTWHPDMPRSLVKKIIASDPSEQEVFIYIKHISTSGKFVWALAQISHLYSAENEHIGYTSVRRHVQPDVIYQIQDLYSSISSEEKRYADPDQAILAGEALLNTMLQDQGHDYPQFIWSTMSGQPCD